MNEYDDEFLFFENREREKEIHCSSTYPVFAKFAQYLIIFFDRFTSSGV